MIMVGIPVVLVSRNTTRAVMAPMSKAKELRVTANIKSVAKNVPDTTTPPAISRPDTSKTEVVRVVPVLNIRLNAILTAVIPELILTVALQAVAERAVKMTAELITPSALVRPCMNGARQRKNASARRDINTLAPAATSAAVRAIAAMENIRNANVKPDSRGVPPAECVSASCDGKYQKCKCKTGFTWSASSGMCVCNGTDWCTLNQDCASLGYKQQSCPELSIKCPFNTNYVYCISCPSKYKYTCSGTGYSGGSGTACGGKYTTCTCKSPYTWTNGACSCPSTYKYACTGAGYAGGTGSACGGKYTQCKCASGYKWDTTSGTCKADRAVCEVGTLYYSDNTCSSSKVSGKTLLGVVIYSNGASGGGWIMTINPIQTNIAWDTGSYYSTGITDKAVSASCTNTQKLVAKGSRFAAATAANNYKPTGTPSGKSWCLPSYDLLNNLNNSVNFAKVNAGITIAGGTILGNVSGGYEYVWSSSEYDYNGAWYFYANTSGSFNMGSINKNFNYSSRSVRPVLAF